MKKSLFTTLIISLFFISSCSPDDGLREVYMEVNIKDEASSLWNELEISLYDPATNTGIGFSHLGSQGTGEFSTSKYVFTSGTNLNYNLTSTDVSTFTVTIWSETRVRIYSNSKKIFDKTYEIGDTGFESNNIIID